MQVIGLGVLCAIGASAASLSGIVTDVSGAPVAGASVAIVRPAAGSTPGMVLGETRTSESGSFRWRDDNTVLQSPLRIRVSAPGFATAESAPPEGAVERVVIQLAPESVFTSVTISATPTTRGLTEEALDSPHVAIAHTAESLRGRWLPTLGHALSGEPGILLQQSTWAQASPFLRGLTGYHVLNLVDGIRFSNSTFRSGPNQYLALLEPSQAQRVEAVLGPAGVSWGSDALGGVIHVVTTEPSFTGDRSRQVHGTAQAGGASADVSGTASGKVSVSSGRFFLLGGLSGRRHNDLRPGGGVDSRNVYRRLFQLDNQTIRAIAGSRQQDSGFRQYGIEAQFAARPTPSQLLSFRYQRGAQDGVNGYKDLLGGLGRLISTFAPQELDWLYARYETTGLGFLDSASGTFSFNGQTDGGRRQNLNFSDPLTTDWARVNVYGYTGQATAHAGARLAVSFGGEFYDEHIGSTRTVFNPLTRVTTSPRPLYPDDSRYANLGAFGQATYRILPRLRADGGVRFTGVRFGTKRDDAFRIPENSQWFRNVTFQSSLQWQATEVIGIHAIVSRGFRAPNLNDLGALGLNDLGYEIPASEAIGAGALLSTDAGEGALSKGFALSGLAPETLMNYELGMRVRSSRYYARAQFFDAELSDPIVRRTLLFAASAVPASLAGLPVTPISQTAAQRQQGVVTVATGIDPRAVKAFVNDGRSRYYGMEAMGRALLTARLTVEANYSYILGRDLDPNRNIRRLPPAMGGVRLRYSPSGRSPWIELSTHANLAQDRLSGGDRDDERIGASFRRADIAAFYRGSRVAPLLDPATGVFVPTGESLLQIQNRVLPIGATINGVRVADDNSRVPLYLSTAGWAVVGIRSGMPLGERWQVHAAIENLLDRNYRYHGSGVDAPGFNVWVGTRFAF